MLAVAAHQRPLADGVTTRWMWGFVIDASIAQETDELHFWEAPFAYLFFWVRDIEWLLLSHSHAPRYAHAILCKLPSLCTAVCDVDCPVRHDPRPSDRADGCEALWEDRDLGLSGHGRTCKLVCTFPLAPGTNLGFCDGAVLRGSVPIGVVPTVLDQRSNLRGVPALCQHDECGAAHLARVLAGMGVAREEIGGGSISLS